ncbi:MAG: glycoside hydrolase family 32 protein [Anaerolineaceae bacterium]|nr:glycoside hydrolase family 32 protein [Anaerolineaceae bacterium]
MQPFYNPHRPNYHFTPPRNWMNDPNGLVYHKGEYHLFYQHHPESTIWGPMYWGHAVSHDLVNWQHLPISLSPDENGTIFSGSAVTDWKNTAGFGKEALVALFTQSSPDRQRQSLSFSYDNGRTWEKYRGNPILESQEAPENFRDPKVFWYKAQDSEGHWVMAVAAENSVIFYTSDNLIDWNLVSRFENKIEKTGGVWETPDLFELPIDNGQRSCWVLTIGVESCAPGGGSGMLYFVGHFDGETFTKENPENTFQRVDFGSDFYAAQSWNQEPSGRRIWIGWMSNWSYANDTPATSWRGVLSIPRQLGLVSNKKGLRLTQEPIPELKNLRENCKSWLNEDIIPDSNLIVETESGSFEIIANFEGLEKTSANELGFRISLGENEATYIQYNIQEQTLSIDRSQSGVVNFNPSFSAIHTAEMHPVSGKICFHIFVDHNSVEIFGNDGQIVFTELIFPTSECLGLEVFSVGGKVVLQSMEIYDLKK